MVNKLYSHLHGVGLRPTHYAHVLETKPALGWFEIITENYIDSGGRPLHTIEQIRKDYPMALHGVSLSLGGSQPFSKQYLKRWKHLIDRIEPMIVSDHLCWTFSGKHNSHDLLPLPFTQEALDHVVSRITYIQEFLKREILIENTSAYVSFKQSEMHEWEFISHIAQKSGCKILLDVNNIYVNAFNFKFDPREYLRLIPRDKVTQFHIAGHTHMGDYLFDTHIGPIIDPVWELYEEAVKRFGSVPTLIEWDDQIPDFDTLAMESQKAHETMHLCLEKPKAAHA